MFARPVINGNTIARSGCLARLRRQREALARETGAFAEERPCFQAPMPPLACAIVCHRSQAGVEGRVCAVLKKDMAGNCARLLGTVVDGLVHAEDSGLVPK